MATLAIYARKSTESEDRQVLSIDSQISELRAFAQREGLKVGKVYRESKSAKSPGRPVFSEILRAVDKGEISGLLCWKLDRLARNPVDGGALIWALETNNLTRIVTPGRAFSNTGDDKFWMQLEFGMAKKYVDDLSVNVKRGLRAKVEQGWQPGVAPLGYLNDKVNKTIVKDPERFPLLRRMWEMMLTGNYSPPDILNRATREWGLRTRTFHRVGGGPMARSAVYDMFRNPFYYGVFIFSGVKYQGAHQPMVTKEEYDQVQGLLGVHGRQRPKRLRFAYTGLIRCGECGASVTAEYKHKWLRTTGEKKTYIYYHCTKRRPGISCSQRVVDRDDLEAQITEYLRSLHIDEEYLKWIERTLDGFEEEERGRNQKATDALRKRQASCKREMSELTNIRLRGLIKDDEFTTKKNELQDELSGIQSRLEDGVKSESETIRRCREVFTFASQAAESFARGDDDTRRGILSQIGSNRTLKDKNLSIFAHKPFEIIREFVSAPNAENSRFEPAQNGYINTRTTPFESGSCAVLGVVDDVRTAIREELALRVRQ